MDKKRSFINVFVSIIFRLIILVVSIIARRFLIQYIGNEINGLHSLYASIVGFLSVAELGVGTAISYSMYKPIVEGNNDKVSALYHLFTKLYIIIGAVILVCGCAIMPALPYLAKGYTTTDVNLYSTFFLFLLSIVLSYLFSSKTSLINAYKDNYITTTINSISVILQYALQIIVLVFTQSFEWFLICHILSVLLQWGITEVFARKMHGNIIKNRQKIDAETKKEVVRYVKAMFMHKIGAVLVNTADSLIISAFIGVVILGKYSNYTTIMTAMVSVISLFFTPLTSILGHSYVESGAENNRKYFEFFYYFNFIIGTVFFLGYYAVIDNLVTLLLGYNLEMIKTISFIITISNFINFMRQATWLFSDATGVYYYSKWMPIFESILNVFLSILFVFVFPEELKVVGVIVATIITNLTICHIVEPYVLYKHAFNYSVKKHYLKNYLCITLFVCLLIVLHFAMISNNNRWIELFANGGISLAISLATSALIVLCNKNFRSYTRNFIKKIFKRNKQLAETEQADLSSEK